MKSESRIFAVKTKKLLFSCAALISVAFLAGPAFGGNFFHGVSPASVPLQGGVAYYQFNTNLTTAEQQTYLNGLREWELAGNIHFLPYTGSQTNWIVFNYAPGASIDEYNVSSTPWTVTVSVLSRSQVCHEMGHVLGLEHENIRTDKNTYITVLTNNIYPSSNIVWFTIDPTGVPYGHYDYASVMHLGNNFSSYNPSDPTIYTQVAKAPYQNYQPFMGNLALSAGDRAAIAYLYGPPTVPLTNVVTNTADAGSGSLRAAIYYGIDHPGSTVRFNIPTNDPGYSNGVFTISLTGFLPPLMTNGVIIDGSTQPGFVSKPLIVIDGSQIISEAYDPGTVTGLYIFGANCQVKNLSFQNFNWNGITLDYPGATNNTVSGCWCGLDHTGANAAPNAYQGIFICNGASYNTIGGTTALARNVLSGNVGYGVYIIGTNTVGNIVRGNYIGTDPTGTTALSNDVGGMIVTGGAYSNVVGGAAAGAGNLLSGNFNFGLWVDSSNNLVQGNWMGLNAAGTAALPNTFIGMYLNTGAQGNSVIGNVFSGNYSEGLRLTGTGTSGNLVQGNFFGTDPTGTYAIPNDFAGLTFFFGAANNITGGATAATRNVMSGNYGYGVAFGNSGTTNNVVEGNYIGLNANGTGAVPNGTGVLISDGAQSNILGGATSGARNIISGNYSSGIYITDPGTSGNEIQGNDIGTGTNGVSALANGEEGIYMTNSASDNIIGLTLAGSGAGNIIAFNQNTGIAMLGSSTIGNTIRGNDIYSNLYLGLNLVGGTENGYGVTANHSGGAVSGPNDLQNYPIITNAFASGAQTIISGTLNSTATRSFWIDCYRNPAPDPSDYGQGQVYLGSVSITTAGSGNASFALGASGNFAGQYITATATDQTSGDTSEFSQDFIITNGPTPPSFAAPYTLTTGSGFTAKIAVTTGQSYSVQSTTNLAAKPIVWANVTNFTASATNYNFQDHTATNSHARFYRVISP